MKKHIIVVGAVAGGATSASQIRRLDKDSRITVYEKDSFMSFANCGLPYYLGNVIEERDDILSTNPEKFKAYKDIDVKVKHEVLKIDDKKQTVTVKNHFTGETFEDAYDALVLSPGARASQLNFDVPHLFTLRNMDDTDQIDTYIRQYNVKTVLIVGAGYVSLEMVENMHHRGLHPTLIHRSEAVNKLMDQDMNSVIFDALNQYNIPYRLNEEIKSIDGHTVTFTSGAVEDYDLIIAGVGVPLTQSSFKILVFNLMQRAIFQSMTNLKRIFQTFMQLVILSQAFIVTLTSLHTYHSLGVHIAVQVSSLNK